MITEQVVLTFPDTAAMAEFIIENNLKNIEVDSRAQTITGNLPLVLIGIARNRYSAFAESEFLFSMQ